MATIALNMGKGRSSRTSRKIPENIQEDLMFAIFKQCFIQCIGNTSSLRIEKGTSRQRSGKGAIRKRFPLQKPRWEKTKPTIRYLYHETYRKPNKQLFPNRWPLSYLNLTKNMETYIRRQQHKKIFIHQNIKQKEPPQKYQLGTISNTKLLVGLNRFYMAITSPSASAVVHNI